VASRKPPPAPRPPRLPKFLHQQAKAMNKPPLDLWQALVLAGAPTPGPGH
jgi:hypothetical protein